MLKLYLEVVKVALRQEIVEELHCVPGPVSHSHQHYGQRVVAAKPAKKKNSAPTEPHAKRLRYSHDTIYQLSATVWTGVHCWERRSRKGKDGTGTNSYDGVTGCSPRAMATGATMRKARRRLQRRAMLTAQGDADLAAQMASTVAFSWGLWSPGPRSTLLVTWPSAMMTRTWYCPPLSSTMRMAASMMGANDVGPVHRRRKKIDRDGMPLH